MKTTGFQTLQDKWPRGYTWLLISRRFIKNLVTDFFGNGCQKSAAALTYMTLFAIVPLMTVMYSMFSVIPAFDGVADRLQDLIFTNFVPEAGHSVQEYLSGFSRQARTLTGIGVAILLITAYLMLTNIEKTFNDIWGVAKPRRGLSSFLLYWAVLSIGPLLLGAGLAASTYVFSLRIMVADHDTLGLGTALFGLLPLFTTSVAFTLLFIAVPNCRVPVKYGLIGGFTTACLFELLKYLFGLLVANSSFQLIYGAFAAVPLFLLWVNLVWTIILAGAILVRTLAERFYLISEGKATDMAAALKCLALFRERARHGERVSDSDCYARGLGVVHWQQLRGKLMKAKWISATSSGDYVLCRDLRSVTLWDLAMVTRFQLSDLTVTIANPSREPWFEGYLHTRSEILKGVQGVLSVNMEDFFNGQTGQERPSSIDHGTERPASSFRKLS